MGNVTVVAVNFVESNVFNYRFSTIEYQKERPYLELATNSIVIIVGDIFGTGKCRAKELKMQLNDLKYVKRITKKQAILLSKDWLGTGESEDVDLEEQTKEDSDKEDEDEDEEEEEEEEKEEEEAMLSESDEEKSDEKFV